MYQKSDLSGTIGIDSGGLESLFDMLVGLLRALFDDFNQIPPWVFADLLMRKEVISGSLRCRDTRLSFASDPGSAFPGQDFDESLRARETQN